MRPETMQTNCSLAPADHDYPIPTVAADSGRNVPTDSAPPLTGMGGDIVLGLLVSVGVGCLTATVFFVLVLMLNLD